MDIKDLLKELEQKRHQFLQMGGPDKVKRQHDKGRLTARERIDRLLDPSSFVEMGLFAHSDFPGMEDKTPADSLICGYGLIDGRRVAVIEGKAILRFGVTSSYVIHNLFNNSL